MHGQQNIKTKSVTNDAKLTVISWHTVQYRTSATPHLGREKMRWSVSVTQREALPVCPGTLILLGSKQKLVSSINFIVSPCIFYIDLICTNLCTCIYGYNIT